MHRILTRSAAAAAGVLLPVILAVFALACTAPHPAAQPNSNSQQATGLYSGHHHHNCRHDGVPSWSRSVKASACVLHAQFSFWFSGSQGTGRAHAHYGDPGTSQSGKPRTHGTRPSGSKPGTPQSGSNPGKPSTPPAGTQPSTPPAGTQPSTPPPAGTQPSEPPAGTQPSMPPAA